MIQLRDYQLETVESARQAVRNGKRAPLIVAPTGAGKTAIGAEIVRRATARGNRALWCAHRTELIAQACTRLQALGLEPGIIAGVWPDAPRSDVLQIASTQTLISREVRPEADVLVLDEAHHYVADEWSELAAHYGKSTIVGLTATPERSDGRGLGAIFDEIIPAVSVKQLQQAGYLVPCVVLRPADRLDPRVLAEWPAAAYLQYTPGKKAVVFCQDTQAAEHAKQGFIDVGVRCGIVSGSDSALKRAETLSAFAGEALDVLCNVHILTEGWDAPHAEVCIIARGCSSTATFLQMVGRVLRPHPGKTHATVLDLTGATHAHGDPDDDRVYSLEGKGIRKKDAPIEERFCPVCSAIVVSAECDVCGWVNNKPKAVRIAGVPLQRFAAKRAEPEDKRRETLRRWHAIAKERGFKPGWAAWKYKSVYGVWPRKSDAA